MAPLNAASAEAQLVRARYFAFPNSLNPLTPVFQLGLLPVAIFSMISVVSVTILLIYIAHRLLSWRKNHRENVGYNQYVILIFNLLLADLYQSIAFSISFHWLQINKIVTPTAPCFIQAWFLHLGDVASGFFVLAIAIHTWLGIFKGFKLPYLWFVMSILFIWLLALVLTVLGPALHHDRFFARAGGWCWVPVDFQAERLLFHYLWIFIVEFGTMAIYGHVFIHLRGRIRNINTKDTSKFSRAIKFMVLYPIVYIILTLPIAVGRMVAMTGTELPDIFFCVAGSLLTPCGWIDAMMYTLTRRVFVNRDLSTGQSRRTYTSTTISSTTRCPSDADQSDLHSMSSKSPMMSITRTANFTRDSNRLLRMTDYLYSHNSNACMSFQDDLKEQIFSRKGSQGSVVIHAQRNNTINVVTEINMRVESPNNSEEFDMILPENEKILEDFGRFLR